MNCDEFRERFHLLVDQGRDEVTDGLMIAHMESCPACWDFRKELSAVDAGLRRLPVVKIPDSLVESLLTMGQPEPRPGISWRPDIERAAVYLLPGILLWCVQWAFPESVRPWFLGAIVFLGGFTLVTSVLRPRVLGEPDA
jgi:hypothetical protein